MNSNNLKNKWRNTVETDLEYKKSSALSARLNLKLGGMNELLNKLKTDSEYIDSQRSVHDFTNRLSTQYNDIKNHGSQSGRLK